MRQDVGLVPLQDLFKLRDRFGVFAGPFQGFGFFEEVGRGGHGNVSWLAWCYWKILFKIANQDGVGRGFALATFPFLPARGRETPPDPLYRSENRRLGVNYSRSSSFPLPIIDVA